MAEGGMRTADVLRLALAVVALLAALSLVTWRQARALEALEGLDALQREVSLVEAERAELYRRIQTLESRGRVVPEARSRLGMRTPLAGEIVLLVGETP
jgi:cell division protein FtsL